MSSVGKNRIAGKVMKVIDYAVFNSRDGVMDYLSQGWELYGTPYNSDAYSFNQAMVKYEEPEIPQLPVRY